jgi:hypothetical protein
MEDNTTSMDDEADQYQPFTDDYTGGGADDGTPEDSPADKARIEWEKQMRKNEQVLQERLSRSAQAVYGENPQEQWKGTPVTGLSMFQGHRQDRQPILDRHGRLTGFRSAPGAPMAQVHDGLTGGQALANGNTGQSMGGALTPQDQWSKMFPGGASSSIAARPIAAPARDDIKGFGSGTWTPVGDKGAMFTADKGHFKGIKSSYGSGYAY